MKVDDIKEDVIAAQEEEDRRKANKLFHFDKKPITKIKVPGRNDKCTCGSNKKYKNCCMEVDEQLIKSITSRYEN